MITEGKMQYLFDEKGRRYLDVSTEAVWVDGRCVAHPPPMVFVNQMCRRNAIAYIHSSASPSSRGDTHSSNEGKMQLKRHCTCLHLGPACGVHHPASAAAQLPLLCLLTQRLPLTTTQTIAQTIATLNYIDKRPEQSHN